MSFLQKLWDETLAGPTPDSGLGRLRKYNSFSASRSPSMLANNNHLAIIPPTIQIPSPSPSATTPFSQAESPIRSPTPPSTPPETPRGDEIERLTRRRSVGFPRRRPFEGSQQPTTTNTPSVYDWIVITALDR